jgi:DHA2 family multidrug resistance protein-like MFS transporter
MCLAPGQCLLAYPMLALELFVRPVFSLSVVTSICSSTAHYLAFVLLPFFVEEALGRSAVGVLTTPWPMTVGSAAPIAGWLVDRNYPAGAFGGI